MESWHGTKFSKYLTLKIIIEFNGWHVELFAVEVGNREYCSKSVLCCFKKLGFNNTLISRTIRKLEQIFFGMFFLYIAGLKLNLIKTKRSAVVEIVKILSVERIYSQQALKMPPTMVGCWRKFWVLIALELLFQHFWDLF